MKQKLQRYFEVRFRCGVCGAYQVRFKVASRSATPAPPKHLPNSCHHCGKPGLQTVAMCHGQQPFWMTFGRPTAPKKETADWIQGGNRHTGKGKTGRPRKKAAAIPEDELEEVGV